MQHSRKNVKFTVISPLVNRYPWQVPFLRRHRDKIGVFADVGAANSIGAPTAFAAKQVLGDNSRVYAVDISKFNLQSAKAVVEIANSIGPITLLSVPESLRSKKHVQPSDVLPVLHSILRFPVKGLIQV